MASSRPAHRPSRREELLDVALGELVREGQADVAIAQIAAQADMTPAAVYYHFSSKDELVAELRRRLHKSLLEVIAADTDEVTVEDWVEGLVNRAADWIRERPDEARFLFLLDGYSEVVDGENVGLPRLADAVRATARIARGLQPDEARVDVTMRAAALVALLGELTRNGLEGRTSLSPKFGTEVHAAHIVARRLFGA